MRRLTHHPPAGRVHHREVRGTRAAKYEALQTARIGAEGWTPTKPSAPHYSFAPSDGGNGYADWPVVTEIFPWGISGINTERDDLVNDSDRVALEDRMRQLTDGAKASEEIRERLDLPENRSWTRDAARHHFQPFAADRVLLWLYRLFDRRLVYWDPAMMGRAREKAMRHLLPVPFGAGGDQRLALIIQRARPIASIATVTRGIATAHVTGQRIRVYPLRLAPEQDDGGWLPIGEADWRENLDPVIAQRLRDTYGPISVEDVAWYVFGVLSAPDYREKHAAELAIDHPRVPFPAGREAFDVMREFGERLGSAHLLEAPMPSGGARLEGAGSGRVEEVRYDAETASVWINRDQHFAGVRPEAWAWGQGFRPLEHFLTDRKGRTLDMGRIEMFCRAVFAVEESLVLAEPLDRALASVLEQPLDLPAS